MVSPLSLLYNLSYRMHSIYPNFKVGAALTILLNKIKKVGAEQLL